VPEWQRLLRRRPQLVTEIAGEAGAGDGHAVVEGDDVEGLEARQVTEPGRLQQCEAGRALQGEAGDLLAFILDCDIEAPGDVVQPGELWLLAAEAEVVGTEAEERAVVDDEAVFVAPQRVADAAGNDLAHIARHQAI